MKVMSEIERFASNIRASASEVRAIVVDGFPSDGSNVASVRLDAEETLRLLVAVKPRLVYLHEDWFDCGESISDISESLGSGSGEDIDISPLSALKRYGKAHDGLLCLVYVGFVVDTVLHLCLEEAEWYEHFQSDASELVDRLKIVISENRKKSNLQSSLEIKRKAIVLANDPAFNFNRAGREKRTYLAEKLFPECDHGEIYQIVDEATNVDFLVKARLSDSTEPQS